MYLENGKAATVAMSAARKYGAHIIYHTGKGFNVISYKAVTDSCEGKKPEDIRKRVTAAIYSSGQSYLGHFKCLAYSAKNRNKVDSEIMRAITGEWGKDNLDEGAIEIGICK